MVKGAGGVRYGDLGRFLLRRISVYPFAIEVYCYADLGGIYWR